MSKLSKNILYNLFGQALLLVVGFIAVRYTFRRLGEDAVGIIYFVQALSALLLSVLEMGIGSTTIREVSGHISEEPDYIRDFIRTGSLLHWGVYVLLALAIYAVSPLLVHRWINLNSLGVTTAIRVIRILGIAFILVLPKSFYVSILCGLQRMDFTNIVEATVAAAQQFGIIVVLYFGSGLMGVAWWLAASSILGILAYLVVSARLVPWRAVIPGFSLGVVQRNFGYSSRMALISFFATIQTQADRAVTSKLLPLGVFGYYAIAYNMVSKSSRVTWAIAQAALPAFCELYERGDHTVLMSQYRKLQDLLCLVTVPVLAAMVFAAVPLFTYILNAEAGRMLLLPTVFLCVGFFMNATLTAPYAVSLAVGRPDIGARSNFYALFAVLPVTILLVYLFGLAGAGFSWITYHFFAYAYQARRTCHECLQISASGWYRHVTKFLVTGSLIYGSSWIFQQRVLAPSILGLITAYAAGTLLFSIVGYHLVGDELRLTLRRLASPREVVANLVTPK